MSQQKMGSFAGKQSPTTTTAVEPVEYDILCFCSKPSVLAVDERPGFVTRYSFRCQQSPACAFFKEVDDPVPEVLKALKFRHCQQKKPPKAMPCLSLLTDGAILSQQDGALVSFREDGTMVAQTVFSVEPEVVSLVGPRALELVYHLRSAAMANIQGVLCEQRQQTWFDYREIPAQVIDGDYNVLCDFKVKRFTGSTIGEILTMKEWASAENEYFSLHEKDLSLETLATEFSRTAKWIWESGGMAQPASSMEKLVHALMIKVYETMMNRPTPSPWVQGLMNMGSLQEDTIRGNFLSLLRHLLHKPAACALEEAGIFINPKFPFLASSPDNILTITHDASQGKLFEPQADDFYKPAEGIIQSRFYVEYKNMTYRYNDVPDKRMADAAESWFTDTAQKRTPFSAAPKESFIHLLHYQPDLKSMPKFKNGKTKNVLVFPEPERALDGLFYPMKASYWLQMQINMNNMPNIDGGFIIHNSGAGFKVTWVEKNARVWEKLMLPRLTAVCRHIYLPLLAQQVHEDALRLWRPKDEDDIPESPDIMEEAEEEASMLA